MNIYIHVNIHIYIYIYSSKGSMDETAVSVCPRPLSHSHSRKISHSHSLILAHCRSAPVYTAYRRSPSESSYPRRARPGPCPHRDLLYFQHERVNFVGDRLREGCHESRRCSGDTYPESNITKYTSIRRNKVGCVLGRTSSRHVYPNLGFTHGYHTTLRCRIRA